LVTSKAQISTLRNPLSKAVACCQKDRQPLQDHRMTRQLALILLAALASPATAQDLANPNYTTEGKGTPGGVARLVLSHQLYALGIANKDPLTVLNAARLAASVSATDTPRAKETTGDATATAASNPTTPAQMFDTAATLAAENDALLDLIDTSRREATFTPLTGVVSTTTTLPATQSDTWSVPFFGASLAELAIIGDSSGNLDLMVTDEAGSPICLDIGPAHTAYCSFYPAENGTFKIIVQNTSNAANTYLLLTN
jgi:hypothetical protein